MYGAVDCICPSFVAFDAILRIVYANHGKQLVAKTRFYDILEQGHANASSC